MTLRCNRAECYDCGDVIESTELYDHVECACGAIALDGGTERPCRLELKPGALVDLSEYESEPASL